MTPSIGARRSSKQYCKGWLGYRARQRETAGPATPATAFQKVSPTSPNNDGYNSLAGTAVLSRFTTWDYLSPSRTLGPISSGYSGYGQAFDRYVSLTTWKIHIAGM